MNELEKEKLRQLRIRFYLTCILAIASTAFCFAGVGLMWSGCTSQKAAIEGIQRIQFNFVKTLDVLLLSTLKKR
ncbi:MAG: hypothetical protein J7647_24775 [Cyanobacteria bacterium SBLK]|nr:hypothetical protein [Cyanobacteria bacterium SBLK]